MGRDDYRDESEPLSIDACLEVLANRQRRVILGHFIDGDTDSSTIETLVSTILDEEARRTGEQPGQDSVAVTLFHVHLPKLAQAGIVEYDARSLEVRYRGNRRLEEILSKIREVKERSTGGN